MDKSLSLYELTGERLALQRKLQELKFDEETIADTLEGESTAINRKIEDYGFVIRNRDSLEDAMSSEIERMTARRDSFRKKTAAIQSWLLENMVRIGIKNIECPAFTIAAQMNPPAVDIFDIEAIPAAYLVAPPPPPPPTAKPDKKLIAAALKGGIEVGGCRLTQGVRLVIK